MNIARKYYSEYIIFYAILEISHVLKIHLEELALSRDLLPFCMYKYTSCSLPYVQQYIFQICTLYLYAWFDSDTWGPLCMILLLDYHNSPKLDLQY